MANVEFRIVVFDAETAQQRGRWGDLGFGLDGLTFEQAEVLVQYTSMFVAKVRERMPLIKRGTGEVLLDPDDSAAIKEGSAKPSGDRSSLAAELLREGDDQDD